MLESRSQPLPYSLVSDASTTPEDDLSNWICSGKLPFTPESHSQINNQYGQTTKSKRILAAEPSSGDFRVAQRVRSDVYKILDEEDLATAKNVLYGNYKVTEQAGGTFVDKNGRPWLSLLVYCTSLKIVSSDIDSQRSHPKTAHFRTQEKMHNS